MHRRALFVTVRLTDPSAREEVAETLLARVEGLGAHAAFCAFEAGQVGGDVCMCCAEGGSGECGRGCGCGCEKVV